MDFIKVTQICVGYLYITIIGSDNRLLVGPHQAIISTTAGIFFFTLEKTLQWNFNRNSYIFINENVFENDVCEMAIISCRPECVKRFRIIRTKISEKLYNVIINYSCPIRIFLMWRARMIPIISVLGWFGSITQEYWICIYFVFW